MLLYYTESIIFASIYIPYSYCLTFSNFLFTLILYFCFSCYLIPTM